MIDHFHLLTSRPSTTSDVLRVLKGLTARQVIDYLKVNNHFTSLAKLAHQERERNYKHSLWQTEKNVLPIFSEGMFMEKLSYIHLNLFGLGCRNERQITVGPVLASGMVVHWRMNHCQWTKILSIGDVEGKGKARTRGRSPDFDAIDTAGRSHRRTSRGKAVAVIVSRSNSCGAVSHARIGRESVRAKPARRSQLGRQSRCRPPYPHRSNYACRRNMACLTLSSKQLNDDLGWTTHFRLCRTS
jgi:hypothetical protein